MGRKLAACLHQASLRTRSLSRRSPKGGGGPPRQPNPCKPAYPSGSQKLRTNRRDLENIPVSPGPLHASRRCMDSEKRIVYIIRSDVDPSRHYVGITGNIRDRLDLINTVRAATYLELAVVSRRDDGILERTRRASVQEVPEIRIGPRLCHTPLRPDGHIPVTWVTVHSEDIGNTSGRTASGSRVASDRFEKRDQRGAVS